MYVPAFFYNVLFLYFCENEYLRMYNHKHKHWLYNCLYERKFKAILHTYTYVCLNECKYDMGNKGKEKLQNIVFGQM